MIVSFRADYLVRVFGGILPTVSADECRPHLNAVRSPLPTRRSEGSQ